MLLVVDAVVVLVVVVVGFVVVVVEVVDVVVFVVSKSPKPSSLSSSTFRKSFLFRVSKDF